MSLSLSEFNINNVFISDDVVKYQINKEGIKFYNGAYYDIYTLPYIRYGLHFISNDDKLVIDKISDSTMKYIIIPNNSYYKPDNEHLELSLKPINDVTLNLNDNVQYIYVNDNIENLTLTNQTTETTNKELILSIPNKNFNITSSDTILNSISHLILRDYNKEYFNKLILNKFPNAKVINLTINSSEGLFNSYVLEELIAVNNLIPNYHYYLYLMKYNMQDIKETLYLSNYDIYEIDTLADYEDVINNNPKFQLSIEDGKIKFNSSNNGFTININTQNIIVYDHYFYYYFTDSTNSDNNKWVKYDLFNGNQEDININSLNVVEINGELIEYSIEDDKVTINNHTINLNGYSVNKIFRCYDLIVFLLTNRNSLTNETSLKILTSDLSFNKFYDIVINDYSSNLRFYFYHSLTIEFINTSNKNIRIVFNNYTTKEILMKI